MNLNDLASFVRVVELGTISAVAEAEAVPKSTISRRIARLEQELGVELLRRSARAFTLTDDGRLLHARSVAAIHDLAEVTTELRETDGVARGKLVLTAPRDIASSTGFVELLAEYRRLCPEVRIEVRLEARFVDLAREGVDVALRAHDGEIPGEAGLMTRALGRALGGLFASPAYLAARGAPSCPAELAEHELVLHRIFVGRPLTLGSTDSGEAHTVKFGAPPFVVDDFGLVQRLLEAGVGIGLVAQPWASPLVAAGLLTPVLPDLTLPLGRMSLVWLASRQLSPRVRCFVALASERLGAFEWITPAPATSSGPER